MNKTDKEGNRIGKWKLDSTMDAFNWLVNYNEDGQLHGECIKYDDDWINILCTGNYINGKRTGTWKGYDEYNNEWQWECINDKQIGYIYQIQNNKVIDYIIAYQSSEIHITSKNKYII